MKAHTSEFKNQIKTMGRELDSKITYTLNGVNIELGKEQLNSITPTYQGSLLKSVMKGLDIDSNVYMPEKTILNYQFGVKVNGEYEYINYGNYIVYKAEKQEDTNSYKLTCYDKMLYSMVDYEKMDITYPISIRDYIKAICNKLGLTFKNANSTFANYNKQIQNELYLDSENNSLGYTFRDVLDELSQVTASCICINENDELEIRYINDTNDTIDEEFLKDVNVNFGEKYGAINTIVLSRSADSDNIYYPETLPEEPYEFKISDNQIMNGNDRADYLPDIYNKLNGLEFYINDFSSTGVCYYELLDRYNVQIGDNIYSCIMFNDEINITQGLEENIYTEIPEETKTDYTKADKTDRRINRAYIIVDKQNKTINATVETVGEQSGAITNLNVANELIKQSIKDLENNLTTVETNLDGLKVDVTKVGAGNLIKDSLGVLNDGSWSESVSTIRDTYTLENSIAGQGIMLNAGIIEQQIQLPNAIHTLSFNYKKRLSTITAKLYINETVYELDSLETKTFEQQINVVNNSVTIKFESDTDNACYILDLMLNLGSVKDTWTQNQNETTTDTVKIGKGVQVESSKMNTYFRADADGTRVVNKTTGEIVREDTDKGTNTNEFVSRSTSIVNGVLFARPNGKHRWISGV